MVDACFARWQDGHRGARRCGREVHRRRGHGGLRPAPLLRGRRRTRGARRAGHDRRDGGAERRGRATVRGHPADARGRRHRRGRRQHARRARRPRVRRRGPDGQPRRPAPGRRPGGWRYWSPPRPTARSAGAFNVQPVPGLELKGLDAPVDAFVIVSERPRGFRLDPVGVVEGIEARDGRARAASCGSCRNGSSTSSTRARYLVVDVVGDAGIGKSRLLRDFDLWLAEQPQVVLVVPGPRVPRRAEPRELADPRRDRHPHGDRRERPDRTRCATKLEDGFAKALRRRRGGGPGGARGRDVARLRSRVGRRRPRRGADRAAERPRPGHRGARRATSPAWRRLPAGGHPPRGPALGRLDLDAAPRRGRPDVARLSGHGRGHHPVDPARGATPVGLGTAPPRAPHARSAVATREPQPRARAAAEGRRPAGPARRPRGGRGRGQPVLRRGARHLAHRLRRRRAGASPRGGWWTSSSAASSSPPRSRACCRRVSTPSPRPNGPCCNELRWSVGSSGTTRSPTWPALRRSTRSMSLPSTTCSPATSSSSASSRRSSRPGSSSSSTRCYATSHTTAFCVRAGASTTGGRRAGSRTSRLARVASRSMRRSSPSTSTRPTTPTRRRGTSGPVAGPVGSSPWTRRPTCSSEPNSWCRPTTPGCCSRSSLRARTSWNGRAIGPRRRPHCAGWPRSARPSTTRRAR